MESLIRPSSLPVLRVCGGQFMLTAMYPEDTTQTTQAAAEGTAAHEVAATILNSFLPSSDRIVLVSDLEGSAASNGVVITREIFESAREYANSVIAVTNRRGLMQSRVVEQPVTIPDLHPLIWGTPDCWLYDEKAGELFVWDFKHGLNYVEVYENWQLMAYASGILSKLGVNGLDDQHIRVHLTIVQPRAFCKEGTERTWSIMAPDLRGYINAMADRVAMILTGELPTVSGLHCVYCSARANCDTLAKAAGTAMQFASTATGLPFDGNAAAVELELLEQAYSAIKARKQGVETVLLNRLQSGEHVPQYVLEPTQARLKWQIDPQSVIAIGSAYGYELAKPVDVITPTQAIKLGMPAEEVHAISARESGGVKIVKVNESAAKRVFGKITTY